MKLREITKEIIKEMFPNLSEEKTSSLTSDEKGLLGLYVWNHDSWANSIENDPALAEEVARQRESKTPVENKSFSSDSISRWAKSILTCEESMLINDQTLEERAPGFVAKFKKDLEQLSDQLKQNMS